MENELKKFDNLVLELVELGINDTDIELDTVKRGGQGVGGFDVPMRLKCKKHGITIVTESGRNQIQKRNVLYSELVRLLNEKKE